MASTHIGNHKHIKRRIAYGLALAISFGLYGCGGSAPSEGGSFSDHGFTDVLDTASDTHADEQALTASDTTENAPVDESYLSQDAVDDTSSALTLYVDYYQQECNVGLNGIGRKMCYRLKWAEEDEWQLSSQSIIGFTYTPGYVHTLNVRAYDVVENSASSYELIAIESMASSEGETDFQSVISGMYRSVIPTVVIDNDEAYMAHGYKLECADNEEACETLDRLVDQPRQALLTLQYSTTDAHTLLVTEVVCEEDEAYFSTNCLSD